MTAEATNGLVGRLRPAQNRHSNTAFDPWMMAMDTKDLIGLLFSGGTALAGLVLVFLGIALVSAGAALIANWICPGLLLGLSLVCLALAFAAVFVTAFQAMRDLT